MIVLAITVGFWLLHEALLGTRMRPFSTLPGGTDLSLGGNGLLGTDGQWWRLITPVVVHFGLLHLAFNMAWLYQLGPTVERIMGRWRLVATYLGTAVAGNVCSDGVYWHQAHQARLGLAPPVLSGGASGAIYGLGGVLVGAWLAARWLDRRRSGPPPPGALIFNEQAIRSLATVFGGYLVVTLVFLRGIDTAAHAGGGLLGLLIGAGVAWSHNGPGAAKRAARSEG
jgi:membrane associated rhomboid family serine protease